MCNQSTKEMTLDTSSEGDEETSQVEYYTSANFGLRHKKKENLTKKIVFKSNKTVPAIAKGNLNVSNDREDTGQVNAENSNTSKIHKLLPQSSKEFQSKNVKVIMVKKVNKIPLHIAQKVASRLNKSPHIEKTSKYLNEETNTVSPRDSDGCVLEKKPYEVIIERENNISIKKEYDVPIKQEIDSNPEEIPPSNQDPEHAADNENYKLKTETISLPSTRKSCERPKVVKKGVRKESLKRLGRKNVSKAGVRLKQLTSLNGQTKRRPRMTSRKEEKETASKIQFMTCNLIKHISIVPFVWMNCRFACYFCKYTSNAMEELKSHMESEHTDLENLQPAHTVLSEVKLEITELVCRHCSEDFNDFESACNHIIQRHGVEFNMEYRKYFVSYKISLLHSRCQLCEKVFTNFEHLHRHVKKDHTVGTNLCRFCGMSFLFINQLHAHLRSCSFNDGKIVFHCSRCELSFTTLGKKQTHESSEHDIAAYKCRVCSETFKAVATLRKHELNQHDIGHRVYCKECPAKFIINALLRQHISTNHAEKVACRICGAKVSGVNLKDHVKVVHTNPQTVPCDLCEQTFTNTHSMRRHRKKHDKKL